MQWGQNQALVSAAQWQEKRQRAQAEAQEALSEHQKALVYCIGARALAWIAQKGCGDSIHGGLQKSPGCGPGQAALGVRAWAEVGPDGPRGSCPLLPFCDSVSCKPETGTGSTGSMASYCCYRYLPAKAILNLLVFILFNTELVFLLPH